MIFKKKKYPEDTRSLEQMYADSSNDELLEELSKALHTYQDFKKWFFLKPHDHFDLDEEMVLTRASIHDSVSELIKREIEIDTDNIRMTDLQWQEYIISNKPENYVLIDLERHDNPRVFWWWWIDILEDLTHEEKSTI